MNQEEKEFLKKYDKNKYEKPSVTADVIVLSTDETNAFLRVLLIRRKNHPFKGCWAIPGGFVNIEEDLDTAARRELKEETGVDAVYLEQLHAFGKVERDPRMRIISVAYVSLIERSKLNQVQAADDAADAKWYLIKKDELGNPVLEREDTQEKMSFDALAFDHQDILKLALQKTAERAVLHPEIAEHLLKEDADESSKMAILQLLKQGL